MTNDCFGPARELPETGPDALTFPPEVARSAVGELLARCALVWGPIVHVTAHCVCGSCVARAWRPIHGRRGPCLSVPILYVTRFADA